MRSGLHSLRQANPGWIVAGIALETLSMAAFALLQRRMLAAAGARLTLTTLLASAYTSNALAVGVPVIGAGIAAASSVRQYRRQGIDPASVGVALAGAGVVSTITFAVVVAMGAILSGNPAGAAIGLFTGLASVAAVTVIIVALRSTRGRARLERVLGNLTRRVQTLAHRQSADPSDSVRRVIDQVLTFQLGPPAIASTVVYGLVNWLSDALCLAVSIAAVGVAVPWHRLLLIWSAGAGAGSFSPTPFGLGVVDIALVTALVASGVLSPGAVGAVLLYRIITFKIIVTLIWIGYRYLSEHRRVLA